MALKNLKVLKEKGIIKLTIGYCTVYDYKEDMFYTKEGEAKDSSDEELQDYITSVYTSRGTLEQLLVSTSVQLMNSEEETTSLNEEMLKMKMKAESMEESLEDKSRMLSAIMRENEKFKRIADETIKLVQEKMKHETENEALKETIHLLKEQLTLFQSEKEEPKDDDIKMPKAKDQELEELKIELAKSKEEMKTFQAEKSKEIEALQEKVSSLSVQLLPKQHSDESCQTDLNQSTHSELIPRKDQATQSMEVLLPEIDREQIKVEGMLTVADLIEIIDLLERCDFSKYKWQELGLRLGLYKTTLDAIEANYHRDVSRCLIECLSKWLCRADNVDGRGGATWDSLSTALRSLNEVTVAYKLDKEKLLPSLALSLYNSYHPLLSQSLSDPISVARLLYGEHVIAGSVLSDVESASPSLPKQCEVLLSAVREAVQSRHTSLKTFASVLCKLPDNVQIGQDILRDYRKFVCSTEEFDEVKIQPSSSLFPSPLPIGRLVDVINLLKRCCFPETKWDDLGLNLGLLKNTLDVIRVSNCGSASNCFTECLSKWLCRVDNVDSRGGATWDSLSTALRSINEVAIADELNCYALAIDIFSAHHPTLSQSLTDPLNVAVMLNREGVITDQALSSVISANPSVPAQRDALLAAVGEAVRTKYTHLQTFASVLCKFTGNAQLGAAIQRDYVSHVRDPVLPQGGTLGGIGKDNVIYVPQYMSPEFNALYVKFGKIFFIVRQAMAKHTPPIEELKLFLEDFNSELETELDNIDTLESVMHLIRENCSLVDIVILEAVVERFKITGAQGYIDEYKKSIDEFCQKLSIILCLNEPFDVVKTGPPLKCETDTFVLGWEPDQYMLKDIAGILGKTTGKLVKIKYIKE